MSANWPPELLNARVVFWMCPIDEHAHRYPEPIRETVRWIDGVAHCMEPGCGRTSLDPAAPPAAPPDRP